MLAVFIIDCGEHTILESMAAEGRLPTLERLIGEGVTVPLRSEAHILDGSVFQTLLTGVNPGRHGIYKYRQLVPGTYRYEFTRAEKSPVPQIWTCLSQRNYRCAVFDVPKAWPVPGFRGSLLASWGAYSPAAEPASIPKDLLPRILEKYGQHPQRSHLPLPIPPEKYQKVYQNLVRSVECRSRIMKDLIDMGPYDFLITAFSETHVGSHQFWHLRDTDHPMHEAKAAELCGDALENIYEAIDTEIGRTINSLPRDACSVVMTQQGVENNYTGSHLIPEWLARRTGGRGLATSWRTRAAGLIPSSTRHRLASLLPSSWTDQWVSGKYRPDGDVFMLPGSEFMAFLRVNLEGREPGGTVPPQYYETTLSQLREEILALRNPDTSNSAVAEVLLPHQLFPGESRDVLPDLIIRWENDAPIRSLDCPVHGRISRGMRFIQNTHSCHTGEGLAVITGPGIGHGKIGQPHQLQDLTSTLYTLLETDPPDHLEGKPISL